MDTVTQNEPPHAHAAGYTGPRLLGIPVGDFTLFQTVLISLASGVLAFFAGTFLAIITLLVRSDTGHPVDYSHTYIYVGLPLGGLVLVTTSLYLGSMLIRRMTRH